MGRKYSKIKPEDALGLIPGCELDVFIWEYIFDGVTPSEDPIASKAIPAFSKRPEANKMLMIRMFAENPEMSMGIRYGEEFGPAARTARHVVTERVYPVWSVTGVVCKGASILGSYGRTLEEAVAKMAIMIKMYEESWNR